ncbi:hypothetical protein SEUCBS140593_004324 [Sporothrix eucalyptigena]|uniref:Uncharacterized protein n=1 Tax=Sporothrix eucalyptigena TaxID=1812306 RepID=A0ABP0BNL7_9PEZI
MAYYTAFRSHRLDGQADSTLAGKMIRLESFLDKRKANKCAEGHMPKSNPAIARMEFDYGGDGSGRNGMFFGRIFYTDGTHVLIYVDCEYQEFGQVDQAEISGKSINPRFKDLCLTSKYDVFVFQYKKVDSKDGTFVIVKYDETPKPTVAEIEEEDSEDDEENEKKRDSDDSTKDEVCQVETSALQEGLVDPEDKDNGNGDPNDVHVDEHKNDSTQDIDDQNKQDHEHRCENTNSHQYDEDDIEEVDRHFASDFVGSYTTLAEANKKAIETFALLTRPRYPARMDAIIFYRDVLQPSIEEKRRELLEDLDAKDATRKAEIVWAPNPQFQYDYEAILVLVAESKIQGPLDLTGAFD